MDAEEPGSFRMVPRRRDGSAEVTRPIDRWPAVREALEDLLAECDEIRAAGQAAFDAPRSLTYRAAEAVVIHFGDLVRHRIPAERAETIPASLPLSAVETTRNILSHNYRAADKAIIWHVISVEIPDALREILAANL
jgi:uncharacterized protein with HEPN domain